MLSAQEAGTELAESWEVECSESRQALVGDPAAPKPYRSICRDVAHRLALGNVNEHVVQALDIKSIHRRKSEYSGMCWKRKLA